VKIILISAFFFISIFSIGQSFGSQIDQYWDNFYNKNPSGIENNFQSIDFIRVMEIVKFSPKRSDIRGDVSLFKKALLSLNYQSLSQMMRDGSFYSRTIKHDDFYYLYNSTYQKISKSTWDNYAPYLIPLMKMDGIIKLN